MDYFLVSVFVCKLVGLNLRKCLLWYLICILSNLKLFMLRLGFLNVKEIYFKI